MQDIPLFEYAVIRVVPRVEREEFLNVGVILYCAQKKFLKMTFMIDEGRLACFSPQLSVDEVRDHLEAFSQISEGTARSGPIGKLDMAARFRWLTATRSTVVQCSKVHPGLSADLAATLARLHQRLVL